MWFADMVTKKLWNKKDNDEICEHTADIDLRTSVIKPLHAKWLIKCHETLEIDHEFITRLSASHAEPHGQIHNAHVSLFYILFTIFTFLLFCLLYIQLNLLHIFDIYIKTTVIFHALAKYKTVRYVREGTSFTHECLD